MRYFVLLGVVFVFVFLNLSYAQLYISEVSDASSYHQEFMEVYNNSSSDIDLHGYKIIRVDVSTDTAQYVFDIGTNETSTISGSDFIVPAHGFILFARGSSLADFETIWGTLPTGTAFNVGNTNLYFGAGTVYRWRLRANDGTADTDDGTLLDDAGQGVGGSGYRDYQQTIGGSWIHDVYENATPGYFDNDQSLPVTLTSFRARARTDGVLLMWQTASEVDNLGFEIFRSLQKDDGYQLVSSFRSNADLKGLLNCSMGRAYRYLDQTAQKGQTYYYKLADVSLTGQRTFHGPLKVLAVNDQIVAGETSVPRQFKMYPNVPNPFNPSTQIAFDLPAMKGQTVTTRLEIYNIQGQKVRTLYSGELATGKQYRLHWDGKDASGAPLPGGIYIAFLNAGQYRQSIKMCLIR